MKTHIITPTPNITDSIAFYEDLQFSITPYRNKYLATDGSVVIEIDPSRYSRAGIKIMTNSADDLIVELQKVTRILQLENAYCLSDPSGTMIYISEEKTIEIKSQDKASILGNFAGLSLETVDPDKTMEIWKIIGFTKQTGNIDQGWVTLTNEDDLSVSIMKPNTCPHLFFNPSLTYFNGTNNPEIIQKVRLSGIPITEEITYFNNEGIVDNIIIRDPGGYGFFIFND